MRFKRPYFLEKLRGSMPPDPPTICSPSGARRVASLEKRPKLRQCTPKATMTNTMKLSPNSFCRECMPIHSRG